MSNFKRLKRKYMGRRNMQRSFFYSFTNLTVYVVGFCSLILIGVIIISLLLKLGGTNIPESDLAKFQIPPQNLTDLQELSTKYSYDFPEVVAVYTAQNNFFPTKIEPTTSDYLEQSFFENYKDIKKEIPQSELNTLNTLFSDLFSEIECFPVSADYITNCSYIDCYGTYLSYSNKTNTGCDIFDNENLVGRIPVQSMTYGVISDLSFDNKLGNCIKITTENGTIYTYTHLNNVAENLSIGGQVNPGEVIGYMGNSGYKIKNEDKNTHASCVHIEISPKVSFSKDFEINPYPFLIYIENS